MGGWHEGPLAGFDTETTGTDTETARIVTAAVIVHGPGPVDARWLVNPGIDIPAEATAVHGISTETAQAQGLDPADALAEIAAHLEMVIGKGVPLVIYNAPYDLTVMDRETRRHGLEPFGDVLTRYDGLIVDPLVLDKHLDPYRKGKRTLTAATEHYKVTLGDAHEARSDVLAAMRVAWKIAALNPSVAAMAPGELHDLQVKAKAAQAAGFQDYLRRQGKAEIIDGSWPCKPYGGVV